MRKLLTLSYALLIAGFACIAHAQLTQTGAGSKAGSGGGGGFTPCAGTAIHLPDPNNLSTANWGTFNVVRNFTATDPNLVANNATDLQSQVGGGSFNANVVNSAGNAFTLTLGTTYSFGLYLKSIVVPPWVIIQVSDGTSTFGAWVNVATATIGTPISNVNGHLTCSAAGAAGNSYTQISLAGNVSVTTTNMSLSIYLVDGNGTGVSTLNQEFNAWQVSP